ncbi:MAG: polysaccharide biosynthesis/export family protein, partial [Thermoanaerobaculia bacterium]
PRPGSDGAGPASGRRKLARLLLAAGCLALLPATGRSQSAPEPSVLQTIEIQQAGADATVVLRASAPLAWTASTVGDDRFILALSNAVAAPEVPDETPGAGLIEAVTLSRGAGGVQPPTQVTVITRQPASYSVAAEGGSLTIGLRPGLATSAGAAEATAAGAAGLDAYHLGPDDVITVDVFSTDELDHKGRVLADGTISLPLLGNFPVAGLTLPEAETKIAEILRERQILVDPRVSVYVEEFKSLAVYVQGAVKEPGSYQLVGAKRLLDVLGEAGGLLGGGEERAGDTIFLLRSSAEGQERIEIDVERLITLGDLSLNLPLRPADTVIVPYAEKVRVYVSGAVEEPGPVEYLSSDGITVLQAVTAAGGPTERANIGRVHILRRLPDGTQERIEADLKKIQRGKASDVPLHENDVVVVNEWFL